MQYGTSNKTGFYVELDEDDGEDVRISPERNLLSGVLERAALDLLDPVHAESAIEWFSASESDNPDVMSFQYICNHLGLDFYAVRQAILVERVIVRKRPRRVSPSSQ
jgi:hypothetical protein